MATAHACQPYAPVRANSYVSGGGGVDGRDEESETREVDSMLTSRQVAVKAPDRVVVRRELVPQKLAVALLRGVEQFLRLLSGECDGCLGRLGLDFINESDEWPDAPGVNGE